MKINMEIDNTSFNGKELLIKDEIFCVVGRHLKKAIIEDIVNNDGYHSIKVKGNKTLIPVKKCIKL